MGAGRAAGEVHAPGSHFHDEQQVIGDQAPLGPDLDGREVDAGQHVPVGLDERFPRRAPPAIRRRPNTMAAENIAHRLIGDIMSQVGQRRADDRSPTSDSRGPCAAPNLRPPRSLAAAPLWRVVCGHSPTSWPPAVDASAGSCRGKTGYRSQRGVLDQGPSP